MDSLFSYYGGKGRMAHNIIPLIPPHTVYVEPFCGAASVFFAKPWTLANSENSCNYQEVLNDIDGDLVNLFRVMQNKEKSEALIYRLSLTPYARAEHDLARQICKSAADGTDIDRAWAYFTNIMMSFANIFHGGWGTGVFGPNLAIKWNRKTATDRLRKYTERLRLAHLECDDAIAVIKRWDSPQSVFYCDPPYSGTNQGYAIQYTNEQYRSLISALSACQGSFVLSSYENDMVPAEWPCHKFKAKMSCSKPTGNKTETQDRVNDDRTECVWVIDRSAAMRPELWRICVRRFGGNMSLFEEKQ